jgi:hypothetical protein
MDFKDLLKQHADKVGKLKEQIATEEATKNAFIMPFIHILGYDVFNPLEVVPEMDCDLVKKKGEKIDYAIMKDGEPIILIECKHWKQNLNLHDNQLQKYFVASKAKFGILTNGITYRFYTDLVKPNIMDDVPFLEINIESIKDNQIDELKKFHKSYFDVGNILSTASELKYMSELKNAIKTEFNSPTPEFVKLLAKRVYDGVMTAKALEQFTDLVKRTLSIYINDVMSEKLNVAIKATETEIITESTATPVEEEKNENKIVTTEEELEAFYIVKSILRNDIPSERVTYRDALSYFAIFADDNNRRPICRIYLNTANKYIGLFDENNQVQKYSIANIDEIYNYSEQLRETIKKYL